MRPFLPVSFALALSSVAVMHTVAEDPRPATKSVASAAMEPAPAGCDGHRGTPRRLSGVVTDPTGASVPHAQITLTCDTLRTQITADAAGAYAVSVPYGEYEIKVEAPNFGAASQKVNIADSISGTVLNPILQVGNVRSAVTVTATEGNEFATPVSTGGTKTDLPLAEVPQAISVVNRSLMDSQEVVKLDDALKNVPGVIAGGYYDGWDYYRIRGFDASFNTYIDGLRGGNGMMEETWGLESVEVLKGPSSALYGQSVLGGLVNIVTRKPVPDFFVHAQVTAGSFNFVDPAVDIGGSLNSSRTVYGRLAALYHSANTFVDYTYRHRYYFAPSLTWKPRSSTWLTLTGRFQRDNGRQGMPLPAIGTVLPNPGNGILPISTYIGELEANANKMSQANQQFGVQFHHSFSDNLIFRENARFAWYQQNWSRIYYPAFLGADNRTLYRYPYSYYGPWQTHETDTNIEGRAKFFGMEHSALLGLDFFRNPTIGKGWSIDFNDPSQYEPLDLYKPVYGQNPVQSLIVASDTKTVTQYTGLYLQDHIRLPKHVTITGGGRFDWAKNESRGSANQNGHGVTPRLGVTWQAFGQTTVYASFSKSYLPQSGLVYVDANTSTYLPPERGQQWEGGVKSSFLNGKLLATAALFQLDRKNVATANQAVPNYYLVTGAQRSRGVELEATLHPLAGWNIVSSYSFINAIVTNDTTLPAGTPTLNAPKHLFNVWSTYEISRGRVRGLTFGFGGRHYTDQSGDLANSFRLPAYGIVDASASYRRGHAMWQVNANNITNKRWYAGSYNDLYVKPGDPRIVRGTMSWNF